MNNNNHQFSIKDLAQFMQSAKDEEKPYIFLTGAGCSVTAGIPLAKTIVEELNEKFSLELKSLSVEERKDYGKCMECIEVSKRRIYLKKYIKEAKINWAHIALSCLIKEGYIRRVLTFNFDNLLARSCGLLGLYPATYDFTAANLNLHSLIDDPAIVHLHGQGHGFVQLNTQSETGTHAKHLKEFITHTLNESPTLFIGYSGQNDAFLPQIQQQFTGQHRLFWVDMGKQAPEHLKESILESRLANYMSCEDGADLFLLQLARTLECFPPIIFADPYQHLLDELDEIANYPILNEELLDEKSIRQPTYSNDSKQDILLETKAKLKQVQQQEKGENTNFLQEYLQGNYQEIIQVLENKQSLNHEQSLWLARSYLSLALEDPNDLERIRIYDDLLIRFRHNDTLDMQEQVAKALVNKAVMLEKIGRLDDAVEVCDDFIDQFGDSDELIIQVQVARALNGMGYSKLLKAKKQWKNPDEAQDFLSDALKDLSRALILLPENYHAMILGNLAYVKFLQKEISQSEIDLRKALDYGGQYLYESTLQDIERFPISPDIEFRYLLEKFWKDLNE